MIACKHDREARQLKANSLPNTAQPTCATIEASRHTIGRHSLKGYLDTTMEPDETIRTDDPARTASYEPPGDFSFAVSDGPPSRLPRERRVSRYAENMFDIEAERGERGSDRSSREPEFSFPQFRKLPPELRRRVWEMFCPDLTAKSRILNFEARYLRPTTGSYWDFEDGMELTEATLSLRMMAAVYKESRSIVTNFFPDTLEFHANYGDLSNGVIHYNKHRDVVLLKYVDVTEPGTPSPGNFCDQLHSVAFYYDNPENFLRNVPIFVEGLPNVKNIYMCQNPDDVKRSRWRWCASPLANCAWVVTTEIEPGLGENTETVYCWLNSSTASMEPIARAVAEFMDQMPDDFKDATEERGIQLGPMFVFEGEDVSHEFEKLVRQHDEGELRLDGDDEDEESGSDEESSEDEYESEGIDDDEQPELDESSEDELVPRAVVDGDESQEESAEESEEEDLGEIAVDMTAGRFSSPESEADDADSGSVMPRRPKRRIVDDSDDEDVIEVAEPSRKRARRGPVVMSSDAEDGDESPRAEPPTQVSDDSASSSEDDSSDESAAGSTIKVAQGGAPLRNDKPSFKNRSQPHEVEESSDSESVTEDEENLLVDDDEEDSDQDQGDGNSDDENGYGNGMVDDMASESEDEGEEDFADEYDNNW